ncbi:MAG: hypothetical protein CMN75_17055 [Spirochaeta sp.]|nr:hypothetical protein [Spirochaeta sp.]RPG12713.1 MAG: hypothetical protein CBC32_003015 [Proteobacteria bacterium TMED72]
MTAAAVAERVQELYGDELLEDGGVVQVCSAWRDPQGLLRSVRVGPHAPQSQTDGFVLALARARADVIVTTGQILRDEPGLQHEIGSESGLNLSAWRRERLGRPAAPLIAVLTSGKSVDWSHPVFSGSSRVLLFTRDAQVGSLLEEGRSRGVEVIGEPEPSLASLLGRLGASAAIRTVVLEVGPRSMTSLFSAGSGSMGQVQEWMLSLCLAPSLSSRAQGEAWPDLSDPENEGLGLLSEYRSEEVSGPWAFRRFR